MVGQLRSQRLFCKSSNGLPWRAISSRSGESSTAFSELFRNFMLAVVRRDRNFQVLISVDQFVVLSEAAYRGTLPPPSWWRGLEFEPLLAMTSSGLGEIAGVSVTTAALSVRARPAKAPDVHPGRSTNIIDNYLQIPRLHDACLWPSTGGFLYPRKFKSDTTMQMPAKAAMCSEIR